MEIALRMLACLSIKNGPFKLINEIMPTQLHHLASAAVTKQHKKANNSNRLLQQKRQKCSINVCIHSGIIILNLRGLVRLAKTKGWNEEKNIKAQRQRVDREYIINDLNCWRKEAKVHKIFSYHFDMQNCFVWGINKLHWVQFKLCLVADAYNTDGENTNRVRPKGK